MLRILLVGLLVPGTAGAAAAQTAPRYQGKTVKEWIKEAEQKDVSRLRAVQMLGRIGPDAEGVVPALTRVVADPDLSVRYTALFALENMGPEAREALPALAKLLAKLSDDTDTHTVVLTTVSKMGPAATPLLVDLLQHGGFRVRVQAAEQLVQMGPDAKAAVPALLAALKDKDRAPLASLALFRLGAAAEPALTAALADKDLVFCAEVAYILGEMGSGAKNAVPALAELLKRVEPGLRLSVALSLARIDPRHQDLAAAFTAGLADKDPRSRLLAAYGSLLVGVNTRAAVVQFEQAAQAKDAKERVSAVSLLGQLGPEDRAGVPLLAAALKDGDVEVRRQAAKGLRQRGTPVKLAAAALTAALKDADSEVRLDAARALTRLDPANPDALGALAAALRDKQFLIGEDAARALADAGRAGVPVLTAALGDDNGDVRRLAVKALTRIGPAAVTALPKLIAALDDKDFLVSDLAASALPVVGAGKAREVVPALAKALKSGLSGPAVAKALGSMGPEAVPVLLAALQNPQLVNVHEPVTQALGMIGPGAKDAVAALSRMVTNDDTFLRREAVTALARIGPAARAASPALVAALRDGDAVVRRRAAAALKQVDPEAAVKAGVR